MENGTKHAGRLHRDTQASQLALAFEEDAEGHEDAESEADY